MTKEYDGYFYKVTDAGYDVKTIQNYLLLSCPQPIYRWFQGRILTTVDHLLNDKQQNSGNGQPKINFGFFAKNEILKNEWLYTGICGNIAARSYECEYGKISGDKRS